MAVLPPDPIYTLRCPEMGPIHSICFHRNERLLAGTEKGYIYVWDLQTNRSSLHFNVGEKPIMSLHHLDDYLISQEKGGTVTIWSMSNTGYVRKFIYMGNYVGFCRMAILRNGENPTDYLIFFPNDENIISIVSIDNVITKDPPVDLAPDMPKLPKLGMLTCIKPFKYVDKCYVLAGYESGHFMTWDLAKKSILDIQHIDCDAICVDYNPLSNRGVIAGATNEIYAFTYKHPNMQLQHSSIIAIKNPGINCIPIRHDMKVFCSGGWDGRIRIFSWKSLRPLAVLTEHKTHAVMDIAYSPGKVPLWQSPIMAAAGLDGQISLWDLYN